MRLVRNNFSHLISHLSISKNLFIDALPENVLSGPYVCERIEMREEFERIMEQELVEETYKEWCWPKIRW